MDTNLNKTCFACGEEVKEGEGVTACADCSQVYHTACFEKQGCTNPACKSSVALKEVKEKEKLPVLQICTSCGESVQEGQQFCSACGKELVAAAPAKRICLSCGNEVAEDRPFCGVCGQKFGAKKVFSLPPKPDKSKLGIFGIIGGVVLAVVVILLIVLQPPKLEGVSIVEADFEITEGQTKTLSCYLIPRDVKNIDVTWTSSDEKVATVDAYGKVTAIAEGTCVITVKAQDKEDTVQAVILKDLPDFQKIYKEFCVSTWAEVGSDGTYLEIDTNPFDRDDYHISAANDAVEKINSHLGLPSSLMTEINHTSYSMGRQTQTFEKVGITVTWTYHPDQGLEIIYKHLS